MDLINVFSSVVLAQHQSFTLQALVSTPLTLNQSKDIHVGSFLCKAGLFYPRKSLFPLLGYFFSLLFSSLISSVLSLGGVEVKESVHLSVCFLCTAVRTGRTIDRGQVCVCTNMCAY